LLCRKGFEASERFFTEEIESGGKKFGGRTFCFKKWAKIECQNNFLIGIGLSWVAKGGLCMAPPQRGTIIPLTALDLGLKTVEKRTAQGCRGVAGQSHDVGGRDPVEISPNFAPIDLFGVSRSRNFMKSFQTSQENGEVSFVAICRVVKIEDMGASRFEDLDQVRDNLGSIRLSNGTAGVSQLDDGGVLSEIGSLTLLLLALGNHFRITHRGEGTGSGGASAIGDDDTRETILCVAIAGGDSWEGENFEVIRMCTDS